MIPPPSNPELRALAAFQIPGLAVEFTSLISMSKKAA
jgi:hypothetical protein